MKALSFTQPWATLVVTGEKKIETRSWKTNYRGVIAIHAAKGFPRWAKDLIFEDFFKESLAAHHYLESRQLPTGAIIGFARITACYSTAYFRTSTEMTSKEKAFGDYGESRWGWLLENPQIIKPIECKGALGIWEVPTEIEDQIKFQMGEKFL
jgi:activating signal cointegrator 1